MSTPSTTLAGRGVIATGAIAGAAAGVINIVVFFIAKAAGVSLEVTAGGTTAQAIPFFMPFVASFVVILAGSVLLKYLGRSARGITIWTVVATVFLVVYTAFGFSAAGDTGTGVVLTVMHFVAFAVALALVIPAARRAL